MKKKVYFIILLLIISLVFYFKLQPTQAEDFKKDDGTKRFEYTYHDKNIGIHFMARDKEGNPINLNDKITPFFVEQNGVLKYGYNLTIPDKDEGVDFIKSVKDFYFEIDSQEMEPILMDYGFYFEGMRVKDGTKEYIDRIEYSFLDIIETLQIKPTYEITKTSALAVIDASLLNLNPGETISFDPTIILTNAPQYSATLNNVTQEFGVFAHTTLLEGLVLYYSFDLDVDTTTNTTYDYSSYNHDGKVASGTTTTTLNRSIINWTENGYIGGAWNFTNMSWINISNNNDLLFNDTQPFFISLWIKPTEIVSLAGVIGKGSITTGSTSVYNWVISFSSSNRTSFNLGNGSTTYGVTTSINTIRTNQWQMIACGVNESLKLQCYYNGLINVSSASPRTTGLIGYYADLNHTRIGRSSAADSISYKGLIDEVMIFNRSLNSTEIMQLYNLTYPRFYQPASMNFTSVNISQDGTLNKLNITINNSQFNGSSLSARFRTFDSSNNELSPTSWQSLGHGIMNTTTFDISTSTYNVSLEINFSTGQWAYYSPEIYGKIILTSWSSGGGGNSCTYSGSGNWVINCSDNCVISTDFNVLKNNISCVGNGNLTILNNSKIFNWTYRYHQSSCYYQAFGTGGFYYG